ncbi:MAG: 50S ribosomal protein L13 [Patescibacteria group bacterium]|nr:50S ribosomal protein L13 [Patescibacteria group bacterium]
MKTLTKVTKPVSEKEVKREWYLVDVKNQILGRVAGKISQLLQGKHKKNYVPYLDMGDYVVVVNAKEIKITGKKEKTKVYTRYSGYPGGLKEIPFQRVLKEKPEEIIKHAVSGMLPKNKLRDKRLKRLFIFTDEKHPYQKKIKISLKS